MTTAVAEKILIVDDDPSAASSVTLMLEGGGFHSLVCRSGQDAIETVERRDDVSLVLMDIELGAEPDGVEAARRILEFRSLPVVFLTCHGDRSHVERAEALVNYGYVLKDSGQAVITATVSNALKLFRAQEQAAEEADSRRRMESAYRSFVENFQGIAFRLQVGPAGEVLPVFLHGATEQITGYTEEEFTSGTVFWPDLMFTDEAEVARQHMDRLTTTPGYSATHEYRIRTKDNEVKWVREVINNVCDADGRVQWIQGAIHDINEQKRLENELESLITEKEHLMSEVNHRVKNNLAMVSSLIGLKDEALAGAVDLSDIQHQVRAISLIHRKLHESQSLPHIAIDEYLYDLLMTVFRSGGWWNVSLDYSVPGVELPTGVTTTLGLLVNELATNAMKYGFAKGQTPYFAVKLTKAGALDLPGKGSGMGDGAGVNDGAGVGDGPGMGDGSDGLHDYVLTVSNGGPPVPDDIVLDNPDTLGLRLVCALTEQLNGSIELEREPSPRFTIRFRG